MLSRVYIYFVPFDRDTDARCILAIFKGYAIIILPSQVINKVHAGTSVTGTKSI